jgi:hypothetical protein
MSTWDSIEAILRKYGWSLKVWAEPNVVKCQIIWLEDDDVVEEIAAPTAAILFDRLDGFCRSRLQLSPG